MKALSIAALAALLSATPMAGSTAAADEVMLYGPGHGATLQSDDIAMSLYFTETPGDGFAVVATYVSAADAEQPNRLVMNLADGDSLRFGLPGHPGILYQFARNGHVVTVSDEVASAGGS